MVELDCGSTELCKAGSQGGEDGVSGREVVFCFFPAVIDLLECDGWS